MKKNGQIRVALFFKGHNSFRMKTSRGGTSNGGRQMANLSKVEVVAVVKVREQVLEVEKASLVRGGLGRGMFLGQGGEEGGEEHDL